MYRVENINGETVDTAADAPHAKLAAILKREATGETFTVYAPNGEFVSRHGEAERLEAERIADGIEETERNMRRGARHEK